MNKYSCLKHKKIRLEKINIVKVLKNRKFPTTNMMKNMKAQIGPPGNLSTTSGYVMNTRPGPELTTSSTLTPWKNYKKT